VIEMLFRVLPVWEGERSVSSSSVMHMPDMPCRVRSQLATWEQYADEYSKNAWSQGTLLLPLLLLLLLLLLLAPHQRCCSALGGSQ
jgi:hypothetical protein